MSFVPEEVVARARAAKRVQQSMSGRCQVAYAVGRRTGGAVERNRTRRRLRAVVRATGPEMAPGAYLISAEPAVKAMSFHDLETALRSALRSACAGAVCLKDGR